MSFLLPVNSLPDTTLRLLYLFVKMWYQWTPVVKPSMTFPGRSSSSRVQLLMCVHAHCVWKPDVYCFFPYSLSQSPLRNLELISSSRPTDQHYRHCSFSGEFWETSSQAQFSHGYTNSDSLLYAAVTVPRAPAPQSQTPSLYLIEYIILYLYCLFALCGSAQPIEMHIIHIY